jgi:hypothetical protein
MADGDQSLRHVTRDVDPSALADLLARPLRATLAYAEAGAVELVPVRARWRDGAYFAGAQRSRLPDLDGREVVLVIDDGPYWFLLRGVSVRGTARRTAAAEVPSLVWYEVEPRRILAWDYGSIREE